MLFSGLVGVLLLILTAYLLLNRDLHRLELVAGALIIGGGTSNLLDRLLNNGAVVDFLNVGIGPLRTGIFNVADMTIMLGVAVWLLIKREPARGGA